MPEIVIVSDKSSESLLIRQALVYDISTDPTWTVTSVSADSLTIPELRRLHPDLIIVGTGVTLDNGLQTCRQIKLDSFLAQTPILLLTAPGQIRQHMLDSIGLEIDDFIHVPFDEIELQVRVRNLLRAKLLQDQLYQARLNQNDLFEMLVHDIGNMVTIMSSALSFYHYVPTTSSVAAQSVYDAYESSVILARMLNDLLDVARLESQAMPVHRQETNVSTLLQTTVDLMQSAALEKQITLDLQIDARTEPVAYIDSDLLQRMVTNLLMNAVNYSPSRSHVIIKLVTTRFNRLASRFQISISDRGPGIPVDQQADLFDKMRLGRYYVEKKDRIGHGLGLIFCRLAAEAQNGTIEVHSTPGQGSTFILDLPYR